MNLGGETSNVFHFQPYLGKIPILTNIFQIGWSHHRVTLTTIVCPARFSVVTLEVNHHFQYGGFHFWMMINTWQMETFVNTKLQEMLVGLPGTYMIWWSTYTVSHIQTIFANFIFKNKTSSSKHNCCSPRSPFFFSLFDVAEEWCYYPGPECWRAFWFGGPVCE